jgi:hypothetical protein
MIPVIMLRTFSILTVTVSKRSIRAGNPAHPRGVRRENARVDCKRRSYSRINVDWMFPNRVIRADDLARAMVGVTIRKRGERGSLVFENRDIRAMVESVQRPANARTVANHPGITRSRNHFK